MTLIPESSVPGTAPGSYATIESLAGVFHPHAIEIQDFPHYRLLIDLRSAAAYENDHIPGAVHLDAGDWSLGGGGDRSDTLSTRPLERSTNALPPALASAVAPVRLDQALLVYDDQGGRVSSEVARALRWRGWSVDVLHGGWTNYRRWVLAGLEVLPRLVPFRVISSALGSEMARVLAALRQLGHQVLDLEALAGVPRNALSAPVGDQPAQALFDSQLLQALRDLDPRVPVWVDDMGARLGSLALPGALRDALAIAPVCPLQADLVVRVGAWVEDEPLCGDAYALIRAVTTRGRTPSPDLLARWHELALRGDRVALLSSLLQEHVDVCYQEERIGFTERQMLSPLQVDSLAVTALTEAVQRWMPPPLDGPMSMPT